MSNICRLCHEEKSPLDFTVNLNDPVGNNKKTYKELIEYHARVKLSSSIHLPQLICEECKQTVGNFVEFSKKVKEVQSNFEACDKDSANEHSDPIDNICDTERNNEPTRRSKRKFTKRDHSSGMQDEYLIISERPKRARKENLEQQIDTAEKLFSDVINGTSIFSTSLHININEDLKTKDPISEETAQQEGLSELRWKDLLCCGLCCINFSNIIDLNRHIEKNHGAKNKAYGCKNCEIDYVALYDSSLVNHHVERHFREHLMFCCLVCSKLFYNIPYLVEHYKSHAGKFELMICYICGFYAKSLNELKDHKGYHIQIDKSKPENQILCDKVLQKYIKGEEVNAINSDIKEQDQNSDGSVKNHEKLAVNWDFAKYTCPISSCAKQVSQPFELLIHIRLKHPKESEQAKKMYSCTICSERKDFSGMHYFYNHMAEHHFKSLKFTCIICSRLFWNFLSLALHYKNVHSSFTSVFCCHCGKIYHSITSAAIHYKKIMILMTDEEKKMAKEGKLGIEPTHICHVCGKACKSQYTLVKHLTTHEAVDPSKMMKCHICSKLFNSKNKLSQHMIGHNNQRKWKCSTCGMSFNFKKLLQMHTRAVHEQERSFLCNFCDKRFFKKYDLTVHVRLHTGVFPYSCPAIDCEAKYPAWSNLFKHCQSRHKMDIRSEGYKKLKASENIQNDSICSTE